MHTTTLIHPDGAAALRPLPGLPARLLQRLRRAAADWRRRAAERAIRRATEHALLQLDARQLHDLGIDRCDIAALAEAAIRGDATRLHIGVRAAQP